MTELTVSAKKKIVFINVFLLVVDQSNNEYLNSYNSNVYTTKLIKELKKFGKYKRLEGYNVSQE